MVEIIKSPNDDRSYRHIVLENKVEVVLINDPTTDNSAASLSVDVGSYQDPDDLSGLAHFLEHLLFMGTEKYPDELGYVRFLNEHNGKANAFTGAEQTNYHFEIAHQHLESVLDRFSQFFIAPLFAESAKSREIQAVNSENSRNLQSDMWRLFQLDKSLSNKKHPVHKFATGNSDTLGKEPQERGIDVRERLIEFYKQHYTSSIMKLVVLGRESLDVLESWVRKYFSAIPNTHPGLENQPRPYSDVELLLPEHLNITVKAKSVMDMNMVEIQFPIPDQQPLYETQPYVYFVNLLGHESKGSLLYYLKEKGWATELSSVISHICVGHDYLYVSVELTDEGLKQVEDIIDAVFSYIEMLRKEGPQEWFFEEVRKTSEVGFLYQQKSNAMSTVTSLAGIMHRPCPRERLLNTSVITKYDESLLREFLNYLVPENARATIASSSFENLEHRERWYGTEYSVAPTHTIKTLATSELHMPMRNEFITENFELVREAPGTGPTHKQTRPRLLTNTPSLRLWHKLDDQFRMPKAQVFVKICYAEVSNSPLFIRTADLFTSMVNDILSDYAYYADVADVSMNLSTVQDGLEIEVHGFSDKLHKLLELVVKTIYTGELTQTRFELAKEQQRRQLSNLVLAAPDSQRMIQCGFLLLEKTYPLSDRLAALATLQFPDVEAYAKTFRSTPVGIEMLVNGNKTSVQAREMAASVQATIAQTTGAGEPSLVHSTAHELNTSYKFEPGMNFYRTVELEDPENVNSGTAVLFQCGSAGVENAAMLSLLVQVLNQEFFSQLRTKEQLGYVVFAFKTQLRSSQYCVFFVQSEDSSEYLESRIENFITNTANEIFSNGLTDEEFARHVAAATDELQQSNKNLTEESIRFWAAINSGFYDFNRRERIAKALAQITKDDVIAAYHRLLRDQKTRARFALHLRAQKRKPLQPEAALARAVGQLVVDRKVDVSPAQIQNFVAECAGLTPPEALQKLTTTLVQEQGMSLPQAAEFVQAAVQRSQELVAASIKQDSYVKPQGTAITSLPEYYAQVSLEKRAAPVDPLESYMSYVESGPKL